MLLGARDIGGWQGDSWGDSFGEDTGEEFRYSSRPACIKQLQFIRFQAQEGVKTRPWF